jgi:hypothetical protein
LWFEPPERSRIGVATCTGSAGLQARVQRVQPDAVLWLAARAALKLDYSSVSVALKGHGFSRAVMSVASWALERFHNGCIRVVRVERRFSAAFAAAKHPAQAAAAKTRVQEPANPELPGVCGERLPKKNTFQLPLVSQTAVRTVERIFDMGAFAVPHSRFLKLPVECRKAHVRPEPRPQGPAH